MEKNTFYPGENMVVTIDADNSKCAKAISKFKFKFVSIITRKNPETGEFVTTEFQLIKKKEKGVEAGKRDKR